MTGRHASEYQGHEPELRRMMHEEFKNFLEDIEFRVAQAYEVEKRARLGRSAHKVYAEDLNLLNRHILTGYTLTANSPSGGSIAWASVHVVYNGTSNTVTDGNTALKFVWWDPSISTTTLQTSNTKPALASNAALLFVNNSGTPYDVLASSIPGVVADSAIDAGAIQAGAVTATKMNTLQHLLF